MVDAIYDAIKCGDLNQFKLCCDLDHYRLFGVASHLLNAENDTFMHVALRNQQIEILQYLLDHYPQMATRTNNQQQTILHEAVQMKNLRIVERLVFVVPDLIGICSKYHLTALQCAFKTGFWQAAAIMISSKPETIAQTSAGKNTLLHYAIESMDQQTVSYALTICHSACLTRGYDELTPLHFAIRRSCSLDIIKLLFDNAPDAIDLPDAAGYLPIFEIVHADTLKYVLHVHPDAIHHKIPESCENLLHVVYGEMGNAHDIRIPQMLFQLCPLLLHEKNSCDESPLHIAFRHNRKEYVNEILRFKPDLVDTDNEGNTVLHMAVQKRCDLDVVFAVFQHCPSNLYCENAKRQTPLWLAVETCNTDVVEMFQPHMTTDMAVALNDLCLQNCQISLQNYAAKQCTVVLNTHLLPDITYIVLQYVGINKKRKR